MSLVNEECLDKFLYWCYLEGYQQVCIFDINSTNSFDKQQPLLSVEGTIKNTVAIGFCEKGLWMYTAGEDKTVKIWDMRLATPIRSKL